MNAIKLGVFAAMLYLLVGLAAVYQAIAWKAIQRRWSGNPALAGSH